MLATSRRHSKYVNAVRASLAHFGHATNAELTDDIRRSYPHLSDTTVHRITQRLCDDGEIATAPHDDYGSMVYDNNSEPHDHFRCQSCGRLRDIVLPASCRKQMYLATGPCKIDGAVLIVGTCQPCVNSK